MRVTDAVAAAAGICLVYTPFLWCRFKREKPEDYGLSWKLSREGIFECLIITCFVLAVLTGIAVNWPGENLPRRVAAFTAAGIAVNGVAAAIIEEIFFRGWIQPLFKKKFGAMMSILFTSMIFALSHVFVANAPFIFAVFFPGCIMGFLRERHGNVSTSTIFHAVCNFWAIWFVPHFSTFEELMKKTAGML
ncbi:MAG: CPBP family intramembrane metalloprotease [Synergistaceae bacterium]|nr:CPBP family intramembrane metalloprotease [Synergistaceae bacterium]